MRALQIALLILVLAGCALLLYRTTEAPQSSSRTAEFGGVSLTLDYATTSAERALGLGNRTDLPDNYGMLFVFPKDGYYGFWMKDTLIPLDMFWLNAQGQVVYIAADVATSTYPAVFYPSTPARYVLETAAGFARAHHITPGAPLQLQNFPVVSK